MRRLPALLLAPLLTAGLLACSAKPMVDDALVEKYIKAYNGLKKASPQLAANLHKSPDQNAAGKDGVAQVESVIKEAGFSGHPEFVKANAAIGMAFSQVQAGAFINDMDKLQKSGKQQVDATLNNPNVPESVKAQIRAQQASIQQDYAKNKGWADMVMGWVGMANDKETIEVVSRHRQELQAAFASQ